MSKRDKVKMGILEWIGVTNENLEVVVRLSQIGAKITSVKDGKIYFESHGSDYDSLKDFKENLKRLGLETKDAKREGIDYIARYHSVEARFYGIPF